MGQASKAIDAISELVKQAPTHPYAKLGETKFKELAQQAEEFFKNAGISTQGNHEENHYRVTPMGTLKPTWLTLKNLLISENEKCLPIQHPGIFNITGFLDFYTRFIADEFLKWEPNAVFILSISRLLKICVRIRQRCAPLILPGYLTSKKI